MFTETLDAVGVVTAVVVNEGVVESTGPVEVGATDVGAVVAVLDVGVAALLDEVFSVPAVGVLLGAVV